ncbi:MAG: hypothetical protein SFY67_01150 [Candidatus Melainabacteria bacterium]|nr:hypothetical protein [Candidatus Melainabacteria bacterium]
MTNTFKLLNLLALALAMTVGLSVGPAFADESKSEDAPLKGGIIYGKDHAYVLSAPDGWVLDNQSGVEQGLHAVFYPEGGNWSDSKAVMYTRIHDKANKTIEEVIKTDLDNMKQDAPNFKAEDQENITCQKGSKAVIKYLSGDKFGSFEAVAYIDEPKKAVIIVLTARDEGNFKSSVTAFNELVKSYFWMTDKVKIEK